MGSIVSTIDIECPPEEVFAYVTDPSRFPEWQRDVVKVHLDDTGPRGVGSRYTTTRRIGGANRTMTQGIIEIDEPRSWAARGIDGPFRAQAKVTVEPLGDGAQSRVTFALDFAGRGLGDLLTPVIRKMAARQAPNSYRNLKQLLESGRHRRAQ
jgi:uncharacterized protein YndB with AHSA1/START domain